MLRIRLQSWWVIIYRHIYARNIKVWEVSIKIGKREEGSRIAVAYDLWRIKKEKVPLAYTPESKIDCKTGQALFWILRLGIMSDFDYETVFFVW